MSKYIKLFENEEAYNTAFPTLDLPNVSLIDNTGVVKYNRATWGASVGDILVYSVQDTQKMIVKYDDWNLTDYPTASYPIIGVVAWDETAAGLTVVSTMFITADGSQSTTDNTFKWQSTNFDWGLTKYDTENLAKTDYNGKSNTAAIIAAIKAYDANNSTDNITGNIGDIIQKYHTEGTVTGDWYIPALGEFYKAYENKTTLTATFNKINSASSSLSVSGSSWFTTNNCWSSSECNSDRAWRLNPSSGIVSYYYKYLSSGVRAFAAFNS